MEEIKKCMRQAKTIISQTVGVMDTNGFIIASTDTDQEGTTDPSARAVMMSDDIFSGTSEKTYMKIAIGEQFKYIIYIIPIYHLYQMIENNQKGDFLSSISDDKDILDCISLIMYYR